LWRAKSPLIECHKGHHVSFHRCGGIGSSDTWQALSSVGAINPCFTSFYKWAGIMVEGIQSCSAMAQGGREGNTFKILLFLPISFLLSLSLLFPSLFPFCRHREGGKERMTDGAQGYRGAQG
jgi:hypothetical protein